MYGSMSQFILDAVKSTRDRRTPMAIGTAGEPKIAAKDGVLDRLSTRFRSRQLDQELARGIPPETPRRWRYARAG